MSILASKFEQRITENCQILKFCHLLYSNILCVLIIIKALLNDSIEKQTKNKLDRYKLRFKRKFWGYLLSVGTYIFNDFIFNTKISPSRIQQEKYITPPWFTLPFTTLPYFILNFANAGILLFCIDLMRSVIQPKEIEI